MSGMDEHDTPLGEVSFHGASEMESLGQPEAGSDQAELGPTKDVIVERRRVGDVELAGVLSTHTLKHAQAITDALRDCDVLAFEQVGTVDEATRLAQERLYTELIAVSPDNKRIEATTEEVRTRQAAARSKLNLNDPDEPALLAEILKRFKGSGKRVVLLDISEDNEDFNYQRLDALRGLVIQSAEAIVGLAPIQESRDLFVSRISELAEAYRVRDTVIEHQLDKLTHELAADEKGPKRPGAMVGMMHYRAIGAVGEPADPAAPQANHLELDRTLSLYERAIECQRTEGTVPPADIDRALLATYLYTPTLTSLSTRQADAIAQKLDDGQVARVLSGIDDYTIGATQESWERAEHVRSYLKAVVRMVEEGL